MARRDNGTPGCIRKGSQQVEGADPAPLVSPREATSGEECYGRSSLHGSRKGATGEGSSRGHSDGLEVWCITYEERL